jgi:hypothetical protein
LKKDTLSSIEDLKKELNFKNFDEEKLKNLLISLIE